jgi:VanZ family protein
MRLSVFRAIHEKKILALICFGILSVMSVAAFWPFKVHPANHVAWLSDQNGLRFNGAGIVLSTKSFEFAGPQATAGVSLELWLEGSQENYSNALLAFSSPADPEQFRLRQSHDFLLILQEPCARPRHMGMTWLWVPHAFQPHKRRFIAISSGESGTTVYLDGIPAEKSSTFKIDPKGFSGQLIVGTAPTVYDTWRGKLVGLAIFRRELTSSQLSEHYQSWLDGRPEVVKSDHPAALYTFAERSGSVVHNQTGSGPDLAIPASYSVPYKPFLKSPWREFYPNQAYIRDALINIAGFVPLGFFFCMLFSSSEANRKAVITTIILGAIFSLTIEILQGFIPVRDSGTTDIITNTLGTALGAILYREGTLKVLLARLESRMVRNADLDQS